MNKEKLLDTHLEDILEELNKRPPRTAGTKFEKKIAKDQDKRSRPKIYAIDFDGTIVEDAFPDIGALKEDAKSFINKVSHNIISRTNTCRNGCFTFLDKCLRITKPYVSTMRKTRNIYQIDKLCRFCFFYKTNRKVGTKLWNS